jgi:di/tricarboxylate transporter
MFIPIIVAVVNAYRAPSDSRFAANLVLHVLWANNLSALLWYTALTQTPQIMGMLKSITGYGPSYLVYVVWNFVPCIIFGVCLFFIVQWIMPAEKTITQAQQLDMLDQKLAEMGKMSAPQWTALIFFMAAVILWATEPFHHIDSAWVAFGLGGLLFMPGLGVLNKGALTKINWDVILLMAVAISFTGIMKEVKLDLWLIRQILTPILNPFVRFGNCGLSFGLAIIAGLLKFILSSSMGETALLAPIVIKYAHMMGYNSIIAALVTSRAELCLNLFPYQGLTLIVLWGTGYMDIRKCLKAFSVTSAFVIIWLVAMTPIWEWTINLVK